MRIKTGCPVRFEITEQSREAVDDYLKSASFDVGAYLFAGRADDDALGDRRINRCLIGLAQNGDPKPPARIVLVSGNGMQLKVSPQ